MTLEDLPDKIRGRILLDEDTECWLWAGPKNNMGYGLLCGTRPCKSRLIHRVLWHMARGPIPAEMFCLHHCDRPLCCNPEHLFLGTQQDNQRDMATKRRGRKGRLPYGVNMVRPGGYQVLLTLCGRPLYLGYFHSFNEAAQSAEKARKELYGG